ncbi:hypothetical protein F5Y06DRAFT_118815 [Hypoxylon sp. FL0890]|nr:hypothetical protein F5Y06DRAFT_118815 [Hypoxylon sp. FL0890]
MPSCRANATLLKPICLLTSLFFGIGGFLYGYDLGIITPTLALKSFLGYSGQPDAATRGAIVSVCQAGAWFGSASVGITSERFGAIAFGCIWGPLFSLPRLQRLRNERK